MSYSPGYSIDTRAGGDTVLGAFEKYNAEAVKIYGILNELKDNDLTPSELEELKTGNILGSRITGTVAGYIDGSHITGNVEGLKVLGELTKATIAAQKVTGLTEFVNDIIDDGGGSTDKGDGITQSMKTPNGYAVFGNGLIVQWGNQTIEISSASYQTAEITFPKSFESACFGVMLTLRPLDGTVFNGGSTESVMLVNTPTKTGFRAGIVPPNQSAGTVYYVAIGV